MKRFTIILAFLALSACAKPRHTAVVVDAALYESLAAVHSSEQLALCGLPSCASSSVVEFLPGWTLAKSQSFNKKLLPAVEGGKQFNHILSVWQPGTPMPEGLNVIITSVTEAVRAVTQDCPDGTTKAQILAHLGHAQSIVLGGLQLVLAMGGR